VLLSQRRAEEIAPIVPDGVPVYVVPEPLIHRILGFKFHSGVIACGRRKPLQGIDDAMNRIGQRATIVICPEVANTENLGAMMRIAAGFGADLMLLGERSCDPFYRQSIRVSMGTVFSLNLVQSANLLTDMQRLKQEWGVDLIATVLDDMAEELHSAKRGDRVGLVFGNEAQGLPDEIITTCDRRVTIPMKLGTDSLNVAVAAGVFLFHFTSGSI
jgi:tRNA G18 (ribose-2'-O)-methylase SpoU